MDFNSILLGIWSGFLIAFFGYLKTVQKDENGVPRLAEFESLKFIQTIAIGAIAGAYASYSGLSYDAASTVLFSMGIVTIVEYILKTIIRFLKLPISVTVEKEPQKFTRGRPAKMEKISVKDLERAKQWILHSRILEAGLGIFLAIFAIGIPVLPDVGPTLTSWILIGAALVLVLHALVFKGSE